MVQRMLAKIGLTEPFDQKSCWPTIETMRASGHRSKKNWVSIIASVSNGPTLMVKALKDVTEFARAGRWTLPSAVERRAHGRSDDVVRGRSRDVLREEFASRNKNSRNVHRLPNLTR